MIALIAKLPIKEGKMDEAVAMFKELASKMTNDEGTEIYKICVDKNNPNVLTVIEGYKDEAALKLHSSTEHFKAFVGKSGAVVAGRPEISRLEVVASI